MDVENVFVMAVNGKNLKLYDRNSLQRDTTLGAWSDVRQCYENVEPGS